MARSAERRIPGPPGPGAVRPGRWHGSLDTITDSERRALRPIGATAQEIAARTGALLGAVLAGPAWSGVRVFQGVRPAVAEGLPRIPHAVSAGRRLILIESVAWPPGRYRAEPSGRINCDGTYIGQSVRPLLDAVRYWRESLPRGHRVSALVVVHPAGAGDLTLPDPAAGGPTWPAPQAGELAWSHAGDAVRAIRACLPRGRPAASAPVIAALVAATTGEDPDPADPGGAGTGPAGTGAAGGGPAGTGAAGGGLAGTGAAGGA